MRVSEGEKEHVCGVCSPSYMHVTVYSMTVCVAVVGVCM